MSDLGKIHSIESFATFEGAGIRTAVFMQGCPLRCVYCHNPDTHPVSSGSQYTSDSLVEKALRFKPYFGKDGGVTFSGGEPLLQAEFLLECTEKLNGLGINCAVDTSACILTDTVKELYKKCDFIIVDLKFFNKEDYIKHTKTDCFDTVIASLEFLAKNNIPVILRTVIIPTINDTDFHKRQYAEIASRFKNITAHEFKPFHTMGFQKYEELGIENPLKHLQ